MTDLSPDGLFFSSDFLDGPGEPARVWVEIPTHLRPAAGRIELRGEVRWVNDAAHAGGMGIRIHHVSMEDRLLISSLASGAFEADGAASGHA